MCLAYSIYIYTEILGCTNALTLEAGWISVNETCIPVSFICRCMSFCLIVIKKVNYYKSLIFITKVLSTSLQKPYHSYKSEDCYKNISATAFLSTLQNTPTATMKVLGYKDHTSITKVLFPPQIFVSAATWQQCILSSISPVKVLSYLWLSYVLYISAISIYNFLSPLQNHYCTKVLSLLENSWHWHQVLLRYCIKMAPMH